MLIEPAQPGACIVIEVDDQRRVELLVRTDGVQIIVVVDDQDVGCIDQGPVGRTGPSPLSSATSSAGVSVSMTLGVMRITRMMREPGR